jgi:hypothetical protein
MSIDTRNPSRRWTPEATDYLARLLVEADLLDVETVNELGRATRWLLVPVGHAELEWIAAIGAYLEDLEEGADTEESGDEYEPELGSTQQTDQETAWGAERVRGRSKRLLLAYHVQDRDEPSLGSLGSCATADRANQEKWADDFGPPDAEHDTAADEPSLGTTNGVDQSDWHGATSDLELDHDEEHNGDDEGSASADLVWAPDWPPKAKLPVFAAHEEPAPKRSSTRPGEPPITHPTLGVFTKVQAGGPAAGSFSKPTAGPNHGGGLVAAAGMILAKAGRRGV